MISRETVIRAVRACQSGVGNAEMLWVLTGEPLNICQEALTREIEAGILSYGGCRNHCFVVGDANEEDQ
jgi:hypothetical protein